MNAAACFDAATFQRLLADQLSAAEAEAVAAHLEGCDRCAHSLRGLPEDTLAAVVRQAQRLPALNVEAPRLQALIGRVLQLRAGTSTVNHAAAGYRTADGAPPAPAVAPVAAIFGRYRILRVRGRGGMGTVYEAEDPHLRRRVALKVPQFSGSADKQLHMRQRFLREARAAAAVDHANVCKIYDAGEQDGKPFVVMALVNGASLADRLPPGRRVKERQAVALTVRVAEGLLAVHAHGIVHRDLKPSNILIAKDGTPILTDFGLAHIHEDSEHLTGDATVGTPAYMAPEQAVPELGPVTERTDIYSLGVVLFQMLTGRLPLEGPVHHIILHHHLRKPLPAPSEFHAGLEPALDAIVRKATAPRPEDRYPDVRAFTQALTQWLRSAKARVDDDVPPPPEPEQGRSIPPDQISTMDQSQSPPEKGNPRKHRKWLVAASLALLMGGAALGTIIIRDNTGKQVAQVEVPKGGSVEFVEGGKKKLLIPPPNDKKSKEQPKVDAAKKSIDEQFRGSRGLPDGWEDKEKAFDVFTEKNGRSCLQVIKKTGNPFVTLPPLALRGNFIIEGEYMLYGGNVGFFPPRIDHSLTISLESREGGAPITIVIDYEGVVSFVTIPGTLPRKAEPYDFHKVCAFRLTREGERLRVFVNNLANHVAVAPVDALAEYDTVRIGLTAGEWCRGSGNMAKLYSLKVVSGAAEKVVPGELEKEKGDTTLTGRITCARCDLKAQKTCATVIVTKKGGKEIIYYFDQVSNKKYHGDICTEAKAGTVSGPITEDGDKSWISVTKLAYKE